MYMPLEPYVASPSAVVQLVLRECWVYSISVSSGQPALAIHCAPAIEVQKRVTMIEEKCTPYLRSTEWVLLHERSVAFDPSPYVPEQQDAGDYWRFPEAFNPGPDVDPSDDWCQKPFDKFATGVRVHSTQ